MKDKYFEDFRVGEKFHTAEKTLSTEEIIEFAKLYDPQPFHIDEEAAAESPYGGIIASGFHTIGASFRLFIDTGVIGTTGMGSPGMDSVRWIKPVRPGRHVACRGGSPRGESVPFDSWPRDHPHGFQDVQPGKRTGALIAGRAFGAQTR